jgi:DNA-binding NarL/FixJ family response regulator
VIEDRVRSSGGAVVWVFDERRRVRDDVAGRLLALPFVSRVEAVGDPVSLTARLANRLPDVLLVGTQRATDSGLSVATQVLRSHPGLPVLMLGAPEDADTVRGAVALGARGYLRWDASPLELGLGLSRTGMRPEPQRPAAGMPPAPRSPQHAGALGGTHPGAHAGPPSGGAPSWGGASPLAGFAPTTVRSTVPEVAHVALSMREMQVLTGMSQGKSNAQIGRELYLSEDTIKTHARRLFRKLGAKDRAEAVATGFRRGMMV